ncbi:MAG: hypothetical protein Q7K57_23325 [Burkholderiaceae bacterium]|nr:hypothetical protein [Burkholderiaceae bacterium]
MTDLQRTPETSSPAASKQITREQLYEEVWREPMLKVGQRHGVSSSFLARVCSALNVPRPQRGYWAKLEFGKNPGKQPPLPVARAEDKLVWNRTHDADIVRRPLPVAPITRKPRSSVPLPRLKVHPLTAGARELFTKGRKTEPGLLKPSKKLLVDLVVTEALLDQMLAFANSLFQRLEMAGHRVLIAPADLEGCREDVDERELPRKGGYRHNAPSAPLRPTIVVIGTVAIGLTIFEMTEELEAQYIGNSQYVPLALLTAEQRKFSARHDYWTSKIDCATGRMCLQAYSPYRTAHWVTQWRESKPKELELKLDGIVKTLERAAPDVANLVVEGERQAEIQRLKREEEWQRYQAEEARRRRAKAIVDSRADLLSAIASWNEVKRIQAFFFDVEAEGQKLDAAERAVIIDRLNQARELIGSADALETLKTWKAPNER